MPTFKCINKECERFDKLDIEPNVSYKWNGDKFIADKLSCPVCKQDREEIIEKNELKIHIHSNNKTYWRKSTKGTIY